MDNQSLRDSKDHSIPTLLDLAETAYDEGQFDLGPSTGDDSDRRLKTDIVQVGMLMPGLPLYRFRMTGSDTLLVGVMAQDVLEVRPYLVRTDSSGILHVNKAALGARTITWDEWVAINGAG